MSRQDQRLEYLDAMGIQVWVPRAASASMPGIQPDVEPLPAGSTDGPVSSADRVAEAPCSIRPSSDHEHAELARLDWDELEFRVAKCKACELHRTRTQTVFGVGNRQAQWLIIGEAPGEQEDRQGEPFVGRAGQLLNEMLRAIGLQREQVYIANILKCRPPKNRDPDAEEAAACEPFLQRQVDLLGPTLILAVGRIAAQNLLKTATSIGKLRGVVHHYRGIPVIVTYHPAYLLRSPIEKRRAWDDLLLAVQTLQAQNPKLQADSTCSTGSTK